MADDPDTISPLELLRYNIGRIESGNDYSRLGPTLKGGDYAVGKYQVMASNVPSWTQRWLGQSMTPAQFRADPQAQDTVFSGQMGQYLQSHGPQDAASMWFTGRPLAQGAKATDIFGTTGAKYAEMATRPAPTTGLPAVYAAIRPPDGTSPGPIDPSIIARGGVSPPIPSSGQTPGTSLTSVPAAAGAAGGILPGFGTKQASDQFLAGLKQAGITPSTGDQPQQQPNMRPSPIMQGPGLRNASSPMSIGMQAHELEPQLTGYSPGLYGQSLNSQPMAWGSSPIGAPKWLAGAGAQQPQGYGTNLNSLQMAGGLSPYQLQMLMNPMMLDQG